MSRVRKFAGLVAVFCGLTGVRGAEPDSTAPAAIAAQVAEDLHLAGVARTAYEKALTAAREEQARQEVLLQTLTAGRQKAEQQTAAARREIARIRAETAGATSAIDATRAVEKVADSLAETLNRELDRTEKNVFPGIVPDADKTPPDDPGERFRRALFRLENAENAQKEWNCEIVSGWLGQQELAVRLLRYGGTAAWWLSLDGKAAGTAKMVNGKLALRPADNPEIAENIARAFAAFAGRLAPDWIMLPVETAPQSAMLNSLTGNSDEHTKR